MTVSHRPAASGRTGQAEPRPDELPTEQRPLPQLVALHLVPGMVTAALFYGTAPLVMRAGFPAIGAGMLGAAVGIVALELGWLFLQARKHGGRLSLAAVLPYRPGRFTWRKALLAFGLWFWGLAASFGLASLKPAILETLFWWMPAWAVSPLPRDIAATTGGVALVLTGVGLLAINVILGPLTEELYFRGYLLPRLARFGAWAPLINISLFAAYHLWKPWDLLTLIVILLPMGYVVWRTRDIRIGIAVHIGLNGTGFLSNSLPILLAG